MTRPRRPRAGGAAILVALALIVLLGFVALTVDLGYTRLIGAQLQAGADAAALAGASKLDLTADGLLDARQTAVAVAALNSENGAPISLDENPGNAADGDIVLGVWSDEDHAFTPETDPYRINSVQVISKNDNLTPFFSRVAFQRERLGAGAVSIARQGLKLGAGEVPWYLPFGLAECTFDTWPRDALQDMTFVLNPDGADNTGWVAVNDKPDASWIRDQLALGVICMREWYETGQVSSACSPASVGASVGLDNGVTTSALQAVEAAIEEDGIPWDADVWGALPAQHAGSAIDKDLYGDMIVGPLPIFDGGSSYCEPGGGKWTGARPLVGFVWAAVYDVKHAGAAASKNVWVRIDVEHVYDVGDWWGGPDYGVVVTGPPVVVW